MKILYDISTLGIGHANSGRRTGIYRVVENIALEMVQMPECDLQFCSYHSIDTVHESLAYQQTMPALKNIPFSLLQNNLFKWKKYRRKMAALTESLQTGKPVSTGKKLLTKAKIQQARMVQKLYAFGNRQLLPVADLNKADIYHTPFFPITNEVKNTGVKRLFVTCYDLIPIFKPEYCTPEIISRMKTFLDSITTQTWILCISDFTRNELLGYMGARVDPCKVVVTELAASQTFYNSYHLQFNNQVRARYGIPEGPYILSVCTLERRKNIEAVIRAFKNLMLQQHLYTLNLVLVGNSGFQSGQLLAELDDCPAVKKNVILTGFVADPDLAALYSEAMMFVYPSLYEGFGLPPLEAMQCGTPVITSNTTSLPEVVGDAGIMINPTDTDALCQAIWSVYSQPALRRQLSEKALHRASAFSWKRCARETVTAYKASLAL